MPKELAECVHRPPFHSLNRPLRPEIIQNARPHKTKTVKVISSIRKNLMIKSELLT
jgi:hypothetical protein